MRGNKQIQHDTRDTRDINSYSSSILSNPASERSPLLHSRHSEDGDEFEYGQSHRYQFNLQREKQRCRKMFYHRTPKGKAVFAVLFVNFLESFAFYGALNMVRYAVFNKTFHDGPDRDFLFTILQLSAGRVFYPVAGLIADVYLGRYRVIHIGFWLLWLGFAAILTSLSLEWHYTSSSMLPFKILGIFATVLFMLGSASVEATIIPFGVDQIQQGASSDELSSYFSWYYFWRNAGYVANGLCSLAIRTSLNPINKIVGLYDLPNTTVVNNMEHTITSSAIGLFAIVCLTVTILVHFCLKSWFFNNRQRDNPLRTIINVLYFAATVKRHAPRYRRSFRYGEGRKSRIDLAKVEFDGIYSAEEVEDVKTFLRILFLVLSLGCCFITYGALSAMYAKIKYSELISYDLVENSLILFYVPLLNHIILPCFPGVSMKGRIGVGIFFFFLSASLGTVVTSQLTSIHSPHMKIFWETMPIVLFAFGETLVFVSGLEFIYAQSPESMKGLLTGLFYFIFGVFSAVGTTIFKTMLPYNVLWSYGAVLMICGPGVVVYMIVVYCYRNRQRPTNDESEQDLLHRSFAASVYLS